MPPSLALFLLLAGSASCVGCTIHVPISVPALDPIDLSALPRDPAGRVTVMQVSGSRLELDPSQSDALTALGACADLVTHCVSPARSLDACVDGAQACATDTPWREAAPCCPSECREAYHHAREGGATPVAALDAVWFASPDCFPGARAALEAH